MQDVGVVAQFEAFPYFEVDCLREVGVYITIKTAPWLYVHDCLRRAALQEQRKAALRLQLLRGALFCLTTVTSSSTNFALVLGLFYWVCEEDYATSMNVVG